MDNKSTTEQHKDLIRACNLAGLSYADCMRIVAYMPVLSNHEDGGRAATSELEQMRERKDAAYLERNQVVAALAKCFPSGVARTAIEGWSEDWHGCVYIDLPTGQASWHFHDSHAYLFDSLPPYTGTWDGHDTPEKYARLAKLGVALGGEPPCNPHPDAPHGYNRNASHNAGRYVCDCEGWAAMGEVKGEAVAEELSKLRAKHTNLLLDLHRLINWEKPLCDFEEVNAVAAMFDLGAAPVGKARMPEWQPIETAPKDGTEIILSNGKDVSAGSWFSGSDGTCDSDGAPNCDERDAGWLDWSGGMLPEPTHFMPIPAVPGATSQGVAVAQPDAPPAIKNKGVAFRDWETHPLYKSATAMGHFDAGWMRCLAATTSKD